MKAIKVLKTLKCGKVHYSPGAYLEKVPQDLLDELEAGSEFVEEIKIEKSDLSQEDSPKQSEPVDNLPEPELEPKPEPEPEPKPKPALKKAKAKAKKVSKTKKIKKTAKTKKVLKKGK